MSTINFRLTGHDRADVVGRAIVFAFDKRRKELEAEETALGRACYKKLFPEKTRKQAAAMPDGWLHEDECLRVNLCGMSTLLHVKPSLRVPSNGRYGCNRLGALDDQDLRDRFLALEKAKEETTSLQGQARSNLTQMVNRFSTYKGLSDGWPDGKQFYEHLKPKDSGNLPAIQVEQINKMLGLNANG